MNWRRGAHAYLFLAPALILLALFVVWPMFRALTWGFQDVALLSPEDASWVGVGNYSDLLADPRFRHAFRNTALFALMVVPVQTVLALFLALWVDRPRRYWRWLRVAFFVPVVVAMPVLAVLWTMLYQPAQDGQMGLINLTISALGLEPQAWLREPHLALPAIAAMSVWQGVGFQMMIFLAGLQNLSRDQIDAAKIDGAGPVQRLFHVIVPGLKPSIVFSVMVTTILSFRLFVQPYLMTQGGPGDATVSLVQWIYQTTFGENDLGRACAAALVFLLVVVALIGVQRLATREERA